jgi:protein-S-isoprenylcysteine O-methyltransferase Ste14
MAMLSAAGIFLSVKGILPGKISNKPVKIIMTAIGVLLIIEGILLFLGADLNGNLQDNIKQNKLKTNGSYKFVRNPCYCLFLLGCTGALFIAHNPLLLILPPVFYVWMTVILKNTEEKWLTELYGEEYTEYCKRVNRCIPWIKLKTKNS